MNCGGDDDDDVNLAALVSGIGGGDPGSVAAALGSGDPDEGLVAAAAKIGKAWPDMTRDEKLLATDAFSSSMKDLGRQLSKEFTDILVQGKAPIRVEFEFRLVFTDNLDDPRLP